MPAKKQPKKKKQHTGLSGQRRVIRKKIIPRAKKKATLGEVAVKQKKRAAQNRPPTLLEYTLDLIYKNLYILGIMILRRCRRYIRRGQRILARMRGTSYLVLERFTLHTSRILKNFMNRLLGPFRRVAAIFSEVSPIISAARVEGKVPLGSYGRIALSIGKLFWTILATLLNYTAPIAAGLLFYSVVQMYINQPFALSVEYNGSVIGYVETESDFEEASQTLKDRFTSGQTKVEIPFLQLVAISPEDYEEPQGLLRRLQFLHVVRDNYTTAGELADEMVQVSGDEIELAYGFYVNNQFYGAVTDLNFITRQLNTIRERNSTGARDERVEFIKSISVEEGLYPVESIVSLTELDQVINSNEEEQEIYIVQEEDTPSGIAEKNGIPYSQLKAYNPDIEDDLQPGDEVLLTVARPFLSVKNIYTAIYNEPLPYEVEEIETATYVKGYRDVTQEGVNGVREVMAAITTVNGIETERDILETRVVRSSVPERVIVGINDPNQIQSSAPGDRTPSSSASDGFIWPTNGGYISVGLGGYAGHTGIDIPRPVNTPVYAAAAGVVVKAERTWYNYGHYVVIDHGNGYETWYAHNNDIYVTAGQVVNQGDVIAGVGRTGRATGNHLHFEVRYQGRVQNPTNYVGSR